MTETVAVLGSGSWGTALACVLAGNGLRVRLWGHVPAHVAAIATARENSRYLPGVRIPDAVTPETELAALAPGCEHLLVVVPSHAFRTTLVAVREARRQAGSGPAPAIVAWGTKGFEPHSGRLLSDVAREIFGGGTRRAVISGPSFAREVAAGLPAALAVAADDVDCASRVAGWLRSERLRVYINDDMAGVQLGGALKNVMAIAAGICDGLGLGASAGAALITRGLAELRRLGEALGGRAETFMGLTGVGDLVLTCTDNQSRNRRLGIALARGSGLDAALRGIGQEAEGVRTVLELHRMAGRVGVEMPIAETVYRVLYEALDPRVAVRELLAREPRPE